MAKSACPVDEKQRHKFLKKHDFELLRMGKGSHQIWAHNKTGETITLCSNPAKGTWKSVEKQVRAVYEAHHALNTAPASVKPEKTAQKNEHRLYQAFKKFARKAYKAGENTEDVSFNKFKSGNRGLSNSF